MCLGADPGREGHTDRPSDNQPVVSGSSCADVPDLAPAPGARGPRASSSAEAAGLIGRPDAPCQPIGKMHIWSYQLLSRGASFEDLGPNCFDQRHREHVRRRSVRRLEALGYAVEIPSAARAGHSGGTLPLR